MQTINKKKIINDPIYGLINIPSEFIFDIIEHPYFQRLRRIKQLGLSYFVYPGAVHSRFQHVIGATWLMNSAIEVLRSKGHSITDTEAEGALLAILLHDMGHGPYSHTLEDSFFHDVPHEYLSIRFMEYFNKQFDSKLDTAIKIFKNEYPKKFLHQLVSSQLDMDRLDYLRRDSFYTGVSEGIIGLDRIIKMLNIYNDELVVDAKGIYSVEKFLIARRLMYWQVYLHKTVVVTEQILIRILQRAGELSCKGQNIFATPFLKYFLQNNFGHKDLQNDDILNAFAKIDDYDVLTSIKVWADSDDIVLSTLCKALINRQLFKIEIHKQLSSEHNEKVISLQKKITQKIKISPQEAEYFIFTGAIYNKAYSKNKDEKINILYNNFETIDIAEASDISNVSVLSQTVTKYFICYPKWI